MLSAYLWEERQALEELAYQLETEQVLIASARHGLLARSTAAIERALAELTAVEARRSAAAGAVALELGLAANATLSQLADALPDQATALHSHRRNLRELLHQIDGLTEQNRKLLAQHLAATSDALALLGVAPTYGPRPGADGFASADRVGPPRTHVGAAEPGRSVLVSTRA